MNRISVSTLSQFSAQRIDQELMNGSIGAFSIDQLMELAGLSVAVCISKCFPPPSSVLCISGPGNNGGDGLVAARHLHHFGHRVQVCYPKRTNKPLYHNLIRQLEALQIPVLNALPSLNHNDISVIVDAMFGFSFSGAVRPPFDTIISSLKTEEKNEIPIVSVDIPSGWHVEQGNIDGVGLEPDVLISLTAPKACALHFGGNGKRHFLGGRFVPPFILSKYNLLLPNYPGVEQVVEISSATLLPPASDVKQQEETT